MAPIEIIRQFTRTPSLILTYIAFAGNMFLIAAYLSWLPTYFHRVEGLSMEKAGLKGSMIMMAAIFGFPLGQVKRFLKYLLTCQSDFMVRLEVFNG